jgi:hypothetical protein
MSDDIEDIVAMARAAYRDDRLADGALYCKLADEIERLRTALKSVLDACDAGYTVERGAGGMTVEAQMRRSVYVNVPALPIEEARAALEAKP